MNILLVHPKKARDYSVPVPPMQGDFVYHTTVSDVAAGITAGKVPGHAFDVIVLPDWSLLGPSDIDTLKARLTRTGVMVVL